MELADYWHLIRKWGLLVLVGTVLAAAVGYGYTKVKAKSAKPLYDGAASVTVNYTRPPNLPFNPNIDPHQDVVALSDIVSSSAVTGPVSARYHLSAPAVMSVSADVSPNINLLTVHALGRNRAAVRAFALGVAQQLATIENRKVIGIENAVQRKLAPQLAAAERKWAALQQHYYVVCGCIGNATHALVTPGELAALHVQLDTALAQYQDLSSRYNAAKSDPLPPANASPGSVSRAATKRTSTLKTVLPAAIVGLVLSIALAALLDYMQTASIPVLASVTRLGRRRYLMRSRVPILGTIAAAKLDLNRRQQRQQPDPELERRILEGLGAAGGPVAEVIHRLAVNGDRMLYLSSPSRREAKAQTVLSVAVALVERGQRVLVVDADPSSGGLTTFLGFDRQPGLTDYLSYPSMSPSQLLQEVELESKVAGGSLRALPLGLRPALLERAPESQGLSMAGASDVPTATDVWHRALIELARDVDIVLINGAPTHEAPDALALAASADVVVLVVRRKQVDETLTEARAVLQQVRGRLVGVIVNADKRGPKRFPLLEGAVRNSRPSTGPGPTRSWQEHAG